MTAFAAELKARLKTREKLARLVRDAAISPINISGRFVDRYICILIIDNGRRVGYRDA